MTAPRSRTGAVELGGARFVYLAVDDRLPAAALERLSPAEAAVARLVAEGFSNEAIARARGVSPRTVANQLASTYAKLGVGSRVELIVALRGDDPPQGQ